jgi:hypothetical protein
MNPDSCPDLPVAPLPFPRAVRSWETSDFKVWPYVEREQAEEHEAKLIKNRLLEAYKSSALIIKGWNGNSQVVDIYDLKAWLKANPELAERLVNTPLRGNLTLPLRYQY